jgi:hypothetical protein
VGAQSPENSRQHSDIQDMTSSPGRSTRSYSISPELRSRREASHIRLAEAPNITAAALQPGDVLMFRISKNTPHSIQNIGHGGLMAAQAHLIRRQPQDHYLASTKLTHSAMYIEEQEGEKVVVESIYPHIVAHKLQPGEHVVYRYKDPQIAAKAADITKTWVSGDPIAYPFKKVATAAHTIVKHGAELTPQALEAVEAMANQAETPRPEWIAEGAYCSELTAAAFQAAAQLSHRETMEKNIPTVFNPVIARETRLTTPSTLVHAMEKSPDFELVGKLVERSKLRQWIREKLDRFSRS